MNKKKLTIIIATIAMIGIVGGSFAWFTAKDQVKNSFTTGTTDNPDNPDDGVKIVENWDPKEAEKITPGTEVNKDVRAQNTASYDSFIRVKFVKIFTESSPGVNIADLDTDKIVLNYNTENLTDATALETEKWVDGGDGYFYYIGAIKSKEYTSYLLDSVTLDKSSDNTYKNSGYDVDVIAESVQASNGAVSAVWTSTNAKVIDKLVTLEVN